ncbi:MAG: hypothetical protein NTY24_10375, partial [Mycobacterium sp.]|nr:hypothetical protein [Mycobacterium sp.]
MWFDNQLGPPTLHAYNAEGRLFIEYLGSENQGTTGVHQFLGADILEVKRVAEVETLTAKLGTELRPRSAAAQNGDDQLIPSLIFRAVIGQKNPYGNHQRPDSVFRYFAERESLDPDRVTIYWLEPSDAAIHFLPAPTSPNLSIQWPKLKRNYIFAWPETIAEFEPVNVLQNGNTTATALQFAATNL